MPEDRKLPNFNRYPMLWLAMAFAIGILAAGFASIDLRIALVACAILAAASIIFRGRHFSSILILIAFAAAGTASALIERQTISPNRVKTLYDNGTVRSGDPVEIEGVLLGRPEPSIDSVFLTLRAEKIGYHGGEQDVSGNVRLFLPAGVAPELENYPKFEISDLKYGSRLRIACKLKREDEFLNSGVMPKKELLDRLNIDATGSVKSPLLIEHIADESVFLPLAWVYDRRANVIDEFRQNLSPKAAGVMIASLLGNKYFLDRDTADLFRDGGTFHILVISGLHITFIGGLLLLLIRQFTRNRWLQFAVTTTTLWAYTLAVGADVPVVRASIMFTVVLFSYAVYRSGSLLNSLGLCALILLVWRPSEMFDPSFQLTFVSVAAIVACAYPLIEHLRSMGSWTPSAGKPFPPNVPVWLTRFCETLYWSSDAWQVESARQVWTAKLFKSPIAHKYVKGMIQRICRYVFEGLLVSLVVQLWMLPLTVVYFHRISVASILLNLWVSFFIALESFAAVAAVIAGYFSGLLATGFYAITDLMNWTMLLLPRLFSDGGWASFRLPAYTGKGSVIYLLYFLPILLLAFVVNTWKPFSITPPQKVLRRYSMIPSVAALIVLAGLIAFHPLSAPRPDGRLHIDFLDVGQGDAALVTFPNGTTMLVDGGGEFDYRERDDEAEPFERDTHTAGEAVVSQVLWAKGYSRIDHILATHADADHIRGLVDIAKNFQIGSAFLGRAPPGDPDYVEFADVLRRRGVPSEIISRGDVLEFGGALVEVLYPLATDDPNAVSDNDHSIVLRVVFGNRAFLLTGDIEQKAETDLINRGGTLAADLVKVPHHGSRTSSTQDLVDSIRPRYAIISVGRRSPFGHPHADVIARWQAAGASVMTTGEKGMISVSTDGRDLENTTYEP